MWEVSRWHPDQMPPGRRFCSLRATEPLFQKVCLFKPFYSARLIESAPNCYNQRFLSCWKREQLLAFSNRFSTCCYINWSWSSEISCLNRKRKHRQSFIWQQLVLLMSQRWHHTSCRARDHRWGQVRGFSTLSCCSVLILKSLPESADLMSD